MAIVSFWSNGKGENGKTYSVIAIATLLGINHNYKTLVIDTKYNNHTYQDCYWREDKVIKMINNKNNKMDVGQGISGLSKAILSNKTSPEIITNYTKIVFKTLELLIDPNAGLVEYEKYKQIFSEIAKIANKLIRK